MSIEELERFYLEKLKKQYEETGDEHLKKNIKWLEEDLEPPNEDNYCYIVIKLTRDAEKERFGSALKNIADEIKKSEDVFNFCIEWGKYTNSLKDSTHKLLERGGKLFNVPSNAAKEKAKQGVEKAIKDCDGFFQEFKKKETQIKTPRGKFVPLEKRGVTHFIAYCIERKSGYAKDMLRKVYDILNTGRPA